MVEWKVFDHKMTGGIVGSTRAQFHLFLEIFTQIIFNQFEIQNYLSEKMKSINLIIFLSSKLYKDF